MKIEIVHDGLTFIVEVEEKCEKTYNSHAISEPYSKAVCDTSALVGGEWDGEEKGDMWALMNKCDAAVEAYYISIGKKVHWCWPVLEKGKYSFFFKIHET